MVHKLLKRFSSFSLLAAAAVVAFSCINEKNEFEPEFSSKIGYDLSLNSGFKSPSTKGGGVSVKDNAAESRVINIEQMGQKIGDENLYLHTVVQDWTSEAKTKGSIIESLDGKEMGVSAWIYNGDVMSGYTSGKRYFLNDMLSSPWKSTRYWPDADQVLFYAYAPEDVQIGEVENNVAEYVTLPQEWSAGVPHIDYTVPSDITEQSDLLVSSELVTRSDFGKPVPLTFNHALTAVQFMVEGLDKLLIKSVSLTGVKNEERYTFAHNVSTNEENGSWSTSDETEDGEYILDFTQGELESKDGIANNGGFLFVEQGGATPTQYTLNEDNFILFMMPQDLSENAKLVLSGYDTEREEEVTLKASIGGNGKSWLKGKHIIYKISVSDIDVEYVFDIKDISVVPDFLVEDLVNDSIYYVDQFVPYYGQIDRRFKVTSYKKIIKLGETEPVYEKLAWKIDLDQSPVPDWIDRFSGFEGVGVDSESAFEDVYYDAIAQSPICTSHDNLKNFKDSYNNKTLETAYDLSMVSGKMNTANCYIVDAPGYYKLPLVYGNAIVDGADNATAYTYNGPKSGDADYSLYSSAVLLPAGTETIGANYNIMEGFFSYGDSATVITKPWITEQWVNVNDIKSEIVWQDEPCVVTEDTVIGNYLYFRVREDCICECNAMVAIKNKGTDGGNIYGQGDIYWSWHIWVTDKNLNEDTKRDIFLTTDEDFTVDQNDFFDQRKFQLMQVPIGFCDGETKTYKPRHHDFVFCQLENGKVKETKTFTITQVGESDSTVTHNDNVVYYQFGRKDPIHPAYAPPGSSSGKNKSYYTERRARYSLGFGGGRVGFHSLDDGTWLTLADGIKMPGQMFMTPQFHLPAEEYETTLRMKIWYGKAHVNPSKFYVNLWNNNNCQLPMFTYPKSYTSSNTTGAQSEDIYSKLTTLLSWGMKKTIYDPSPAGYELPMIDAFAGLTYGGLNYDGELVLTTKYNPVIGADGSLTFTDDNGYSFRIGAFGHRSDESGKIVNYGVYGAALTSSPVCLQGSNNELSQNYLHPYFLIGSSRLYFTQAVLWPMASSSLALAFPVIPAVTGKNRYQQE